MERPGRDKNGTPSGFQTVDPSAVTDPPDRYNERMRKTYSTEMYSPGELAPVSGVYEIVDSHGSPSGDTRAIEKGRPFPPTPWAAQFYRLQREVRAKYTTVASKAKIDETSATFDIAIHNLARK